VTSAAPFPFHFIATEARGEQVGLAIGPAHGPGGEPTAHQFGRRLLVPRADAPDQGMECRGFWHCPAFPPTPPGHQAERIDTQIDAASGLEPSAPALLQTRGFVAPWETVRSEVSVESPVLNTLTRTPVGGLDHEALGSRPLICLHNP